MDENETSNNEQGSQEDLSNAASLPVVITTSDDNLQSEETTQQIPFVLGDLNEKIPKESEENSMKAESKENIAICDFSGKVSAASIRKGLRQRSVTSSDKKAAEEYDLLHVNGGLNDPTSHRYKDSEAQTDLLTKPCKNGQRGSIIKSSYLTLNEVRNSTLILGQDNAIVAQQVSLMPSSGFESSARQEKEVQRLAEKPTVKECRSMAKLKSTNVEVITESAAHNRFKERLENRKAGLGRIQLRIQKIKAWFHARKSNQRLTFPLWRKSLKFIETRYGVGIASYFLLARWVFIVNTFLAVIWASVVVFPGVLNQNYSSMHEAPGGVGFPNFVFGTGGFALSFFFYGSYSPVYNEYNMALAYMITIVLFVSLSFLGISLSAKNQLLNRAEVSLAVAYDEYRPFSTVTFCSWDYSIMTRNGAQNHSQAIATIYKTLITHAEIEEKDRLITRSQRYVLWLRRALVNLIIVGLYCASGFIIYISLKNQRFDESQTTAESSSSNNSSLSAITARLSSIPAVTVISILDTTLYFVFSFLAEFEKWNSPKTLTVLKLSRSFIFKIASIYIIFISGMKQYRSEDRLCWETQIGQTFYQFVLSEFIISCVSTVFGTALWYFIRGRKSVEFDISDNILKMINRQALLWYGARQ